MPFVIYLLGLAVFAMGTSEFMLSGLVPGIARDLGVTIPDAGQLTSAFAVGMVVGAPLMAVLSLRWSRRRALLTFLAVFLLVHVLGAVTTSFDVLLATRVVAALANAGFLAVALSAAASLVAPDAKGRATAVLLGGVTVACVAGVPAGALLGQVWGWRSAFWAVALVSAPAFAAILKAVPAFPPAVSPSAGFPSTQPSPVPSPSTDPSSADSPSAASSTTAFPSAASRDGGARVELGALRDRRLLVTLLLGALVNGATFCAYTYLAPVVTDVAGMGAGWVPVVLALFGVGSFAGVTAAGRLADVRPARLLVLGGGALLTGWVAFALAAGSPAATIVLVLVQGTLAFAVGSTLISQILYAGPPMLGGAYATAAFNVGAALGPWLGGLAIAAGHGFRSPLWVSALLVALAFPLLVRRQDGINSQAADSPGSRG